MIMLLPVERWINDNMLFVILLFGWLYLTYWVNRRYTIPLLLDNKNRQLIKPLIIFTISIVITYLLARFQVDNPSMAALRRPAQKVFEEMGDSLNLGQSHSQGGGAGGGAGRINNGGGGGNNILRKPIKLHQQAVWFLFVVVTTFSAVVSLLSEISRQIVERQSVEFEKKKAELALYKAQINPHFLFNTLNTLLGMVITKSERTEEAFVQFANLMRYMYSNANEDMIPLQTEVEYINQYVELQRYRLNEHTQIEITQGEEVDLNRCQIAPMLLITFVENALKYGVSPHHDSLIKIGIDLLDDVLHFTVKNPIFESESVESRKGIGIANCKNRLELLYRNNYTLIIDKSDGTYFVSLTIKMK